MPSPSCPVCGSPLDAGLIGGLCPVCVLRTTLAGAEAGPESDYSDGESFAGHELRSVIGRGGMGVVYRAWQPALRRTVALKMLIGGAFAGPAATRRFQREAALAAGLRHPHVVPVYEAGVCEGQAYYTMEYVEGRSLAQAVREDGVASPRRTAERLAAVADAVAAAHALGILHRDLKPSNILLDAEGRPRVADFGLAHRADANDLTAPVEAMGSPPYMAPEQISGGAERIGPLTDVYGLGALLYHGLTGRAPFDGLSVAEIFARVERDPAVSPRRLNAAVPRDLETICLRCLEKDPARRYASAAAFKDDLERFLSGRAVLARPLGSAGRAVRWVRRNPAPAATVGVLVAASLAVACLGWHALRLAEADASKTYASDMLAASIALEAGDFARARDLLAEHAPKPGGKPNGFEWGLLAELAKDRSRQNWAAHAWLATGVAFSPDGRRLATTGEDGELRLWAAHGKPVRRLVAHQGVAWRPVFTADGSLVMTAGMDGRVVVWDTATGEERFSRPGQQGSLSRDGRRLATLDAAFFFWRPAGTRVRVWDVTSGALLREWAVAARGVALSPDGERVVWSLPGEGLRVHAVATGALVAATPAGGDGTGPVFSPDGRLVACGDARAAVCWDTTTDAVFTPPHPNRVWAVDFAPDSAGLWTGCGDRRVRCFSTRDGAAMGESFGAGNEVWGVAVAPDGASVATATKDGRLALWPAFPEPGGRRFAHAGWSRPRFSADGRTLFTAGPRGAKAWDVASGEARGDAPMADVFVSGFSDDGAVGWRIESGGVVRVRETATGREIGAARVELDRAEGAVSRDGRVLLLKRRRGDADTRDVRLVDVAGGTAVSLTGHHDEVKGVALSPDGTLAAYGSVDGNVYLWDVAPPRLRAVLRGHLNEVSDVAFSPDGTRLASIEVTRGWKLWHLPTGRLLMSRDRPDAGAHAVFSPDGKSFAHTLFGGGEETGAQVYRIE